MGSQKQKPINKRLTKFLLHYPTVFFSKDVVIDVQKLTTSELINFEAEIIDNIILFAKKNNICKPKTRDNGKKLGYQICICGSTFPHFKLYFPVKYDRLIRNGYRLPKPSSNKDYFEILSATIVKMLLDCGVNQIEFPKNEIAEEDAILLLEEPIADAVKKLTLWMCYTGENSLEFCECFPNTADIVLFNMSSKNPLSGWNIHHDGMEKIELIEILSDRTNSSLYGELCKKLKEQSEQYLIFGYLWNKGKKHQKRMVEFLKKNCVIYIYNKYSTSKDYTIEIYCKAPIISTIRGLKEMLKNISIDKEYTYPDFLYLLGYIAYHAAGAHSVSLTHEFYQYLEGKLNLERRFINAMLREVNERNILQSRISNNIKTISFTYKDYRLIFEGIFLAIAYNKYRTDAEDIANYMMNNNIHFTGDTSPNEKNHLNFRFNRFVVCNISLLYFIDNRESVLNELCQIAKDFSIKNRKNQVKAIFLLSDYLIDGLPVSSALRKEIYLSTFGISMYSFQLCEIWDILTQRENVENECNHSSTYFIDLIRRTFFASCEFDEDGFAKSDPYFNFWISFIDGKRNESNCAKRFLFDTSKILRTLWRSKPNAINSSTNEKLIYDIFCYIVEAYYYLKEHLRTHNSDILYYVYSMHSLLYSFADLANMHGKQEEILRKISEHENSPVLIECCILCDYFSRKYNRNYNLGKFNEMYILCGPFRLMCAYTLSQNEKYILSEEMKREYTKWFYQETEIRYKALLYRLLSYTNYPIEKLRFDLEKFENKKEEDIFLPYDHITIDKAFLNNPQKILYIEYTT